VKARCRPELAQGLLRAEKLCRSHIPNASILARVESCDAALRSSIVAVSPESIAKPDPGQKESNQSGAFNPNLRDFLWIVEFLSGSLASIID
jgi:hypothetical protein